MSESVIYAQDKADQIMRRVAAMVMGYACELKIRNKEIDPKKIVSVSADPMDRILMATRVMAVRPNDLSRSISFKMDICPADVDGPRVSHNIQFALHLRAKMPERIWRVEEVSGITVFDCLRSELHTFKANPVEPRCLCLIEKGNVHVPGYDCVYPSEKYMLYRS